MKLRSMFAVPMVVIMLITIVLVAVLSAGSIRRWREGQDALVQMEQFRLLMVVQEELAQERAPTDSALSIQSAVPATMHAAIDARRQASDRRLRQIAALPGVSDSTIAAVHQMSVRLEAARAAVDVVLGQDVRQRTAASIGAAIEGLVEVPPLLFPAMDQVLLRISIDDPEVATLLTATRTASDLRLFGGLIAARFAQVMARRDPIKPSDVDPIQIQEGQIIELNRLLLTSIEIANVGEQMHDAVALMEQRYFNAGQRIIDDLIDGAIRDGKFAVTHAEFSADFRLKLATLMAVRDRLFELTRQMIVADQEARLYRLDATIGAGGAVLTAVLVALLILHRRVIRPLAELATMIVRLAEGDRSVRLTVRQGSQELAELARAIEVLRVATLAADAAAAQRHIEVQRWMAQLHRVLETLDVLHDRTATMMDLLPMLLEQLGTLTEQGSTPAPGLTEAIGATQSSIEMLRQSSGRLDAALWRMHAVGDNEAVRMEELEDAMGEVATAVTAIEAAVNGLPQITLCAVRDLPGRTAPGRGTATLDRILAQVQEMAATAGGMQGVLLRAHQGVGELARLRA